MREEFGIPDSEMHRRYLQINLQEIGAIFGLKELKGD